LEISGATEAEAEIEYRVNMIEIKDIAKSYKTGDIISPVLKNISFEIENGEFVAIMGPSGSGKSTLMHILGCLDTPTSGRYFLDGQDVSKLSDDELADIRMRKIGFVFQSFNLLPRATVLRNVSLPLVYADIKKEEREKLAKKALAASAFPDKFWNHYSNPFASSRSDFFFKRVCESGRFVAQVLIRKFAQVKVRKLPDFFLAMLR